MLVKKLIQVSVDLFNVKDIYHPNKDELLMDKLKIKYLNKCFQAILIKKIIRIVKKGDTTFNTNSTQGACYIHVCFEIEGIVLTKGEVYHNCTILETNITGIIFNSDNIAGMLISNSDRSLLKSSKNTNLLTKKIMNILTKNQKIPIIVLSSNYDTGKDKITVEGIPYIPIAYPTIIYKIEMDNNDLSKDSSKDLSKDSSKDLSKDSSKDSSKSLDHELEINKINNLMELLSEEYNKHNRKDKYSMYFNKEVIYPFKEVSSFEQTDLYKNEKCSKIIELRSSDDLNKFLKESHDYITYPLESYIEENINIYKVSNQIDDTNNYNNIQIVKANIYTALFEIITSKINYLLTLRGFVENYNKEDEFKRYATYWSICKSAKELANCNNKKE